MQRAIGGFHQDTLGDWVADLGCGHGQHVRHQPPFRMREWVVTPEGRASRLGAGLDCVRCDRFELPEGAVPYQRSPEPPLAREVLVQTGQRAVIVPEVKHRVRPEGPVRFFVEFHRIP